jgi:hypothetical protein
MDRTFELEYAPSPRAVRKSGLQEHALSILRNYTPPELALTMVCLGNADKPPPDKATPQQKNGPPAHTATTMPTNDEELGNIKNVRVIGRGRSTRD